MNQFVLAGSDVELVDVVQLGDAFVQPNKDLLGKIGADRLNAGLHTLKWSQIFGLVCLEIYAV